jgi:hypothetical protein
VALHRAGGISLAAGPHTAGRTNRAAAAAPVNPTAFTAFAQMMQAAPHREKPSAFARACA